MKKKLLYTTIITVAISLASCNKIVTVNPANTVTPAVALKDVNGYLSLLTSVYDRMQSYTYYGRDMMLEGDALADNILTNSNLSGTRYASANNFVVNNTYNIWTNSYFFINVLNTIIEGLPGLDGVLPAQKGLQAQIIAQAYALRALFYFDIARVYGYEPINGPTTGTNANFQFSAVLRLTAVDDISKATIKNRSTIVETYTQIEADFLKAISLFQAIGTAKPGTVYAFSESAAHGWLAKVYLYWGRYADCVTQCQAALAPTICPAILTPAGTYAKAFTTNPNPESLMELNYVQTIEITGVIGSNDAPYTYTQPSSFGFAGVGLQGIPNNFPTFGGQTVSAELQAAFDSPTDERKQMFFTSKDQRDATLRVWCNKYSGHGGPYTDNMPILRYADVLLMQAEGLAMQGQYGPAQTLITQLRTARSVTLPAVPGDATIIPFIQAERRRELFFEGQRFFDLKRLGQGITKPAATGVGTIAATDYRILAPIPTTEVLFNPSLPKNPNY